MRSTCFSELVNLCNSVPQGPVSVENQDQYCTMIMMLQLLLAPPSYNMDLVLNLLYILDIFCDYDQSSKGEQHLLEGQELLQKTYFAECGIPTFGLDDKGTGKLIPRGQGITGSGRPIMPATYVGITEASVLLFDVMGDRTILRSIYYYMARWMVDYNINGAILTNTLRERILQQNEDKGTNMGLRELDDNPTTIGPRKFHQLVSVELLFVTLLPILAVTRYNMTAKPVTDLPLFFICDDENGKKECPFIKISDIIESPRLEPIMVPSLILSSDLSDLFLKYRSSFNFESYSYQYSVLDGMHRRQNASNKTFGYLIFDLIEKVVAVLDRRDIDVSRSIIIAIIEYLMEFPSLFYEYASLYGWRQDPNSYSTIYTDIIRKYCQTIMITGQKLLDLCFMTVFFHGQVDSVDDVDLESMGDTDDELGLSNSVQELASKLLEEDEQYFMDFFSKFVGFTAQHTKIEAGFLAALGMRNLTPSDLVYRSLSLAIANGCNAGSVRSPIDIFSEHYYYMHSDVMYLFLTGLEYVVFLLRATSAYIPSVGPEDHEIYRETYMFLNHDDVLQIVCNAFGLQTEVEDFMTLLRKILDDIISVKNRNKADYIHSVVPSFFLSAITEIDSMYYRRAERHISVTEQLLEQPTQNLQFTTNIITHKAPKESTLVFTACPVDTCSRSDSPGSVKMKIDTSANQTVLDVITEKVGLLSKMFRKFLEENPASVDTLWPESEYSRQIALFESKYDILYRTLQDICLYSSQTYKDMASVMETYRLPVHSALKTRSSMIRRSYMGGVYRNSPEWHITQLVRNYLMIPDIRSSLKHITKVSCISTGIFLLQVGDLHADSIASTLIQSLQDLSKLRGICSPSRYGLALFFAREKDGSLIFADAHSVFYLTDSMLIALMTDEDSDLLSSRINAMTVFASSVEHTISRSLFGDFVPDTGSSEMVCNGRSYHNLDKCKFCRIQEAIYHGRSKEQNNLKSARQLIAPLVDFHSVLFRRLIRFAQEDKGLDLFQFRNAILEKLCLNDKDLISLFQFSRPFFISNTLSGSKIYGESELRDLKMKGSIRSIYSEERYLRICFQKTGIADLSKIICHCAMEGIFKTGKNIFNRLTLTAPLRETFDECVAEHELPLVLDSVPPSLWVLADSPNFFVVHYNELSYEILRMCEQLGANLACIIDVFDGIGPKEHFLIKVFHVILSLIDPNFGEVLLEKLNEKIIKADVSERKQTATGRFIGGTWKYLELIKETTEKSYADKKPSEIALKLASEAKKNLNYLMTTMKPFVSRVMARIPVKFMTIGQFNELGCPSTLNDLVIIVKSRNCNIDDTRRLLPRSVCTIELLVDEI
ncbi:Hypothetical protein GLP15_4317 [Giardia lamblia P15]|uniref:Uncharacterized protein n=1 Tax=Giardia intestinalis (strain P15) TaxID=658858 RepID=E1EWV3_GIAIA|nr:Hypothetical protein GLP15_4317 [Giardia lamblia P15]